MNEYLLELHAQAFYGAGSDKEKIEAATLVTVKYFSDMLQFMESEEFGLVDVIDQSELMSAFDTYTKNKKDEEKRAAIEESKI